MEFFDVHTHVLKDDSSQRLENIRYPEPFTPVSGGWYSVGVHPWDVEREAAIDWEAFRVCVLHPQVLAVGECGLDKCMRVGEDESGQSIQGEMWKAQLRLFLRQVQIAEELRKPLIIHNVRATDVLLSLRKKGRYTLPWILHGFRGKPEAASQAVVHGCYLSFGVSYNEEALRVTPVERLLLETDDSGADIHFLYNQAAALRSVSADELAVQIRSNIHRLFGI